MRYSLIAALMLLLPAAVSAQSLGSSLTTPDSFTVSINPESPEPYGHATLSFTSSSLDLTNATLRVTLAGKQIYKGNVQPISLTLGAGGSVSVVGVTITSNYTPHTQTVTIQPQEVSLIAEPVASAPVLYPGKPLTPLEGSTRVVAVANMRDAGGKTIDPANLSYVWTVDGTKILNSSGIGRQSLVVASPLQYRSRTISVTVQSQDGNLAGGASLSLDPVEPTVRIYQNDPLFGIRFDHALSGSYTISGTEASLYAAPFSLSMTGGAPSIQWFLNGTAAQTGNLITLRPAGTGQGTAALSLTASKDTSTPATATLSLLFGATSSTNLFGL